MFNTDDFDNSALFCVIFFIFFYFFISVLIGSHSLWYISHEVMWPDMTTSTMGIRLKRPSLAQLPTVFITFVCVVALARCFYCEKFHWSVWWCRLLSFQHYLHSSQTINLTDFYVVGLASYLYQHELKHLFIKLMLACIFYD